MRSDHYLIFGAGQRGVIVLRGSCSMSVIGSRATSAAHGRPIDLYERSCRAAMWLFASIFFIPASASPP